MIRPPNPRTEPCVLEGPRFEVRVCKRCGYRRNRSAVMMRYARCDKGFSPPEYPLVAAYDRCPLVTVRQAVT